MERSWHFRALATHHLFNTTYGISILHGHITVPCNQLSCRRVSTMEETSNMLLMPESCHPSDQSYSKAAEEFAELHRISIPDVSVRRQVSPGCRQILQFQLPCHRPTFLQCIGTRQTITIQRFSNTEKLVACHFHIYAGHNLT